jgi:hypothetical protein
MGHFIQCVECGRRSHNGARLWGGYLTEDNVITVFCPGCALREFGMRSSTRRRERRA